MSAPDPFGLHYDETPDGRPMIKSEIWPSDGMFAKGNRRHRLARVKAVVRKLTLTAHQ